MEVAEEMKELLGENKEDETISLPLELEKENTNKKEEHLDIIKKIVEVEKYFDVVDEYFDNLSIYQKENDDFIEDLLHYVEVHDFTQATALKFVNLLKEKRIKRRRLNNEWRIKTSFDNGRQRFSASKDQRGIFMTSIYKKEKELYCPYKPRQITFEEIDEMIAVKRGRKSTKSD